VKRLFVHALLDGRDVPSTSALEYIDRIEAVLAEISATGAIAAIASGGGRMVVTMDRYEADWAMVERGWKLHVHGEGRPFETARQAVETFRAERRVDDQNLPGFVIARGGAPIGPIVDGDSVVCFNFRGDRAIEISRAFEDDGLTAFDRGRRPDVLYAGMMQYDGDTHVPKRFLVAPPAIDRTMGLYLARAGVTQLAISETQKYGHVTYFWNGNRSGKIDDRLETYVEIPSDRVTFDERPWMKAAEITDRLLVELASGRHRFARVNYANGDMVGHTGNFDATRIAVEVIDLQLTRLAAELDRLGGILLITADHGNRAGPPGRDLAHHRRPRQRRRDVPARQGRRGPARQRERKTCGKDEPHPQPRAVHHSRPPPWGPLRDRPAAGRRRRHRQRHRHLHGAPRVRAARGLCAVALAIPLREP